MNHHWMIDHRVPGEMMRMFHNMAEQISHGVISMRVKEGHAARKAKGLPLGRKKGAKVKSKLDQHKTEIIGLLKAGSTKTFIIRKYDTSKTNLYHWLRKNRLNRIKPEV